MDKNIKKDINGFSLMGIIVSLIIVSLMAAAVLPSLKGIFYEERSGNISELANTLINAESTYVNNNNKFATISELQEGDYLAAGLGLDFVNSDPGTDCVYGSISIIDDTEVCIGVNDSPSNGQEISYTLTISPSPKYKSSPNAYPDYFNFYKEIMYGIPGSSYIPDKKIEYIDPILTGVNGDSYNGYIGRNFYIGGAYCEAVLTKYINSGRGRTTTYKYVTGPLYLYFMVEGMDGNNAVLSYANNPADSCNSGMNYSYTNNAGDSYSYSYHIAGPFQNSYLPEVNGGVYYYVPIEPTGTEIEIPAGYLPDLINLNQLNTYN